MATQETTAMGIRQISFTLRQEGNNAGKTGTGIFLNLSMKAPFGGHATEG
jgi:hypothetical protein